MTVLDGNVGRVLVGSDGCGLDVAERHRELDSMNVFESANPASLPP